MEEVGLGLWLETSAIKLDVADWNALQQPEGTVPVTHCWKSFRIRSSHGYGKGWTRTHGPTSDKGVKFLKVGLEGGLSEFENTAHNWGTVRRRRDRLDGYSDWYGIENRSNPSADKSGPQAGAGQITEALTPWQ